MTCRRMTPGCCDMLTHVCVTPGNYSELEVLKRGGGGGGDMQFVFNAALGCTVKVTPAPCGFQYQ